MATGEACAPTMKRALGSARCGSSRRMVKYTTIIQGFIDLRWLFGISVAPKKRFIVNIGVNRMCFFQGKKLPEVKCP